MFGKNEVHGPFAGENVGDLKVAEGPFYTIQGEGPDAGRPALFVRLSHCNLRCYFCDTKFDEGQWNSLPGLCDIITTMSASTGCALVVITGGEPLLQNIVPLVKYLNAHGISVSVETAGVVYYPELAEVFDAVRSKHGNLIVCSPKTPKINTQLEPLVGAWKYIIKAGEVDSSGIPNKSTQIEGKCTALFMSKYAGVPIYVQAMDEYDEVLNSRNLRAAAKTALRFGYRLSVQMHKLAQLP